MDVNRGSGQYQLLDLWEGMKGREREERERERKGCNGRGVKKAKHKRRTAGNRRATATVRYRHCFLFLTNPMFCMSVYLLQPLLA
jgi:hypothetical protein